MSFDESFWVSCSIILFIILVFKSLKSPFYNALNRRASDVRVKILEAERLKEEAITTLNEIDLLYKNAQNEIKLFSEHLDQEIQFLSKKANQELEEKLKIRENILESKIKNLEDRSLAYMRSKAIKLAVTASIILLRENSSKEMKLEFITKSLSLINFSKSL